MPNNEPLDPQGIVAILAITNSQHVRVDYYQRGDFIGEGKTAPRFGAIVSAYAWRTNPQSLDAALEEIEKIIIDLKCLKLNLKQQWDGTLDVEQPPEC